MLLFPFAVFLLCCSTVLSGSCNVSSYFLGIFGKKRKGKQLIKCLVVLALNRRNEWVSLKSVFCYLSSEFITKALKSKRPQKGTRHYKIIQRVNLWAKGPLLAWRLGDPTNGLHHPPAPLPPLKKKNTETLQFNTTQLSAFYFCVTRTTGHPVYAHGASGASSFLSDGGNSELAHSLKGNRAFSSQSSP